MKPQIPMPNLDREFYTREQFAELFQVSLRTVDQWTAEGKVTFFKDGRKGGTKLFAREAILVFYANHCLLSRDGGAVNPSAESFFRKLIRQELRLLEVKV